VFPRHAAIQQHDRRTGAHGRRRAFDYVTTVIPGSMLRIAPE
jgi:hypothetical protein